MEVHHHSRHPQKLREYLAEFFMLFAAVTLGFIAENFRETYVEKERSHQLIGQLKTDIITNIKLIDSLVLRNKIMVEEFDTAFVYLVSNDLINGDSLFLNIPFNMYRFMNTNDTYEQMKNTASLRYIKDSGLLAKILKYASDCESAETRSSSMEAEFVMGEFTQILGEWMPNFSASHQMYNQRSGLVSTVNRETTSALLIEAEEIKYLSSILLTEKDKTYDKEKSSKIKRALLPALSRRTTLLINTVRFMGVAKASGLSLLEYIEKIDKSH